MFVVLLFLDSGPSPLLAFVRATESTTREIFFCAELLSTPSACGAPQVAKYADICSVSPVLPLFNLLLDGSFAFRSLVALSGRSACFWRNFISLNTRSGTGQ